jgi:AraC-like DNA-binding protein
MAAAEKGSISIAFVREVAQALRRRGRDPAPFLARAGIAPALLGADSARVTPESFGTLWLSVAAGLNDEFFGLDAHPMKVGGFTTLCHLTLGAANLREALVHICRFFNLLLDETRLALAGGGAETSLRISTRDGVEADRAVFAHETLLVMLHGLLCWLAGRRVTILRARFGYPRPAWWPEYLDVFSAELGFDAGETTIVLGSRHLQLPVVQTRQTIGAFLRGAPSNFILKYRDEHSLGARVRHRLRGLAPEAWPSQAQLARDLRLGSSTLHRQLDREGTSFRAIKEALRRDLAIRYLSESAMSVGEIAGAVGFAEPSAFRRAFRQWTGLPPRAFRPTGATTEEKIRP